MRSECRSAAGSLGPWDVVSAGSDTQSSGRVVTAKLADLQGKSEDGSAGEPVIIVSKEVHVLRISQMAQRPC